MTFPPSGKAFPRFEADEIDYMLETGEIPKALSDWLELALEEAKNGDEDEVTVGFFIKHKDEDEIVDEAEEEAE